MKRLDLNEYKILFVTATHCDAQILATQCICWNDDNIQMRILMRKIESNGRSVTDSSIIRMLIIAQLCSEI